MFSVFCETSLSIDRSSFRSVDSLFHARGAATEQALSLIHRHVRGMTRSPHDEACSADRAGISATGVSKSGFTAHCLGSNSLTSICCGSVVDLVWTWCSMIGFNVTTSPKQIDTKTLLLRFVVQIVVDLRYNKLYKNPPQIHNK